MFSISHKHPYTSTVHTFSRKYCNSIMKDRRDIQLLCIIYKMSANIRFRSISLDDFVIEKNKSTKQNMCYEWGKTSILIFPPLIKYWFLGTQECYPPVGEGSHHGSVGVSTNILVFFPLARKYNHEDQCSLVDTPHTV